MTTRFFRLAAPLFICLIFAATASAQDFTRSYPLGNGSKVRISSVSGNIIVKGYNGDSVVVTGIREGRDRDMVEIEDRSSGNAIDIGVRYPKSCNCDASVRFEIQVPSESKYDFDSLSSASGDIEVSGVRGNLNIKTASGDVRVSGFDGEAHVSSASGDVHVGEVRGTVSARAASGDVEVEITRLEGAGNMEFSTASGDVRVSLPGNLDADVDMSTVSGSLETDFPIQVEQKRHGSGRRASGRLGSGSRTLRISAASGDVTLKRM
jgi:DUF4097 and DUF4098 domain-containing protein YvlB